MKSVVYINGDGIGIEVMRATRALVDTVTKEGIEWIEAKAGENCFLTTGNPLPPETLELIREHKVAIKGPTTTPSGGGFTSVNVRLRQELDLYVGLRPSWSLGLPNTRRNVNLTVFRQNTEGLYACKEEVKGPSGSREVLLTARFSEEAMYRLALKAFHYARAQGLTHMTLVNKENIHKVWGRVYHDAFDQVAASFPDITADHMLVDAMGMRLVSQPEKYQVLVIENMFGDILSDVCAGLVGGLGVTPGANLGEDIALFEAVHGSAPDIAGRGIANPTALMLSAAMMLDHMGLVLESKRMKRAIIHTLKNNKCRTGDLGGKLNTIQFTSAIMENL